MGHGSSKGRGAGGAKEAPPAFAFRTWLAGEGFRPRTCTEYARIAARFLACGEYDPARACAWVGELPLSSRAPAIAALRALARWLRTQGVDAVDPPPCELRGPRHWRTKLVDPLTPAQLDTLKAAAEGARPSERAALLLLVNTGLRVTVDLLGLRRSSVTLQGGRPTALRWRTKGGGERVLALNDCAAAVVAELLARPGEPSDPLVPTTRDRILAVFKRALPEAHLHQIRHAYATGLLAAGANVREVQEALGHASLKTTERYLAVDIARLSQIVRRYNP